MKNTGETLISHHVFLFPFKWDFLPAGKDISDTSFAERTPIGRVVRGIRGLPWEASPFKIMLDKADEYHTFNEYNYFHDYARDALALNINEQGTSYGGYFFFKVGLRLCVKSKNDNVHGVLAVGHLS